MDRRTPKAAPAAARLSVLGPGLPASARPARMKGSRSFMGELEKTALLLGLDPRFAAWLALGLGGFCRLRLRGRFARGPGFSGDSYRAIGKLDRQRGARLHGGGGQHGVAGLVGHQGKAPRQDLLLREAVEKLADPLEPLGKARQ